MFAEHEKFIEWAKTYDINSPPERCRALHEAWIQRVSCPVLKVDGTQPVEKIVKFVAARG
jgi:hypothetical protein